MFHSCNCGNDQDCRENKNHPNVLLDKHFTSAPVEIKSRQSKEQIYTPPLLILKVCQAENLTIMHRMISVASAASPKTKVYCFVVFGHVQ